MIKKRGMLILILGIFLASTVAVMAAIMPTETVRNLKSSDFIELWECQKTQVNKITHASNVQKALGTLDRYPETACPAGFSPAKSLGYIFRYNKFTYTDTAGKYTNKINTDPFWSKQGLFQLDICEKEGDQGRAIIWDTKLPAAERSGISCNRYGTGYAQKQLGYLYPTQPDQLQTPNNAETVLFCKSHNTRTSSGVTSFEYNYDLGQCKAGGIGSEQGYLFKSNPLPIRLSSADFVELKECTQTNPNDATDIRKTLGTSLLYEGTSCPNGYVQGRSLGYIFSLEVGSIIPDSRYNNLAWLRVCEYNNQGRHVIVGEGNCNPTTSGDMVTGGGVGTGRFLGYVYPGHKHNPNPGSTLVNGYSNSPGLATVPNNAETKKLCQEYSYATATSGKFPFKFDLDSLCQISTVAQDKAWYSDMYTFKSKPVTPAVLPGNLGKMTTPGVIPLATPETPSQPVSCGVDNIYKSLLPVPTVWPPTTLVAGLQSKGEILTRIQQSEAKIQDILCRNKCFRDQLGQEFVTANCCKSGECNQPPSTNAVLIDRFAMANTMTGRIVAFFKGL